MQWVTQKKLTCYSLVVRCGNPQSDGLSSENTDQPMATIGLDEGSLVCSDGKGGSAVMTISKMIITLAIVLVGLVFATRSKMDQIRAAVKPTQGCSAEDVLGSYGSATTGLINSSSDPSAVTLPTFMPFAEAAIFVFQANGNLSAASTGDLAGQIDPSATPTPAEGMYTVDPATCTGTMTINIPNGPTFHRNLVIVDGAREIDFVSTDPGFVIAGSMKRQ